MKRQLTITIDAEKTTCSLKNGETCPWMGYGTAYDGLISNPGPGIARHCNLFRVQLKCRSGGGSEEHPAVLRCKECRGAEADAKDMGGL